MRPRAAIFDLGGVVLDSPLQFIRTFEAQHGLSEGFVASLLGSYAAGVSSPWHALERGEIELREFCRQFDLIAHSRGAKLDSASLMSGISTHSAIRPVMVDAIRTLRTNGLQVAALTNIWAAPDGFDARLAALEPEFDVFVESYRLGIRKPELEIYVHVCSALDVDAKDAVFLDDIGANLKTARALGMATIKVTDARRALVELGTLTGIPLAA